MSRSFFRWKLVSISLVVLAGVYWGTALLNLWLVRVLEQRGDTGNIKFLLWGSFWDFVIGILCVAGQRLMRLGSRRGYMAAALTVGMALLIVMRNWLGALLTGRVPSPVLPVLEALLVWSWLIYAVGYAVAAMQKQTKAEPCAPPNGGPATQRRNSGVAEGPPSVS
jgi:hypothetical protein